MKTIIREIIAMIILIAAIMVIIITMFFDYIKENTVEVSAAIYQLSQDEQNILKEKQDYSNSQNRIVLSSTYTIDANDLSYYKSTGNLTTGQSSPFDEIPVTEILHSADGKTYYDVENRVRDANSTSYGTVSGDYYNYVESQKGTSQYSTSSNTTNTSNEFSNDISAPSVKSGSIIPSTGK